MKAILIIVFILSNESHNAPSGDLKSQIVEFPTMDGCEEAAKKASRKIPLQEREFHGTIYSFCVEKK